MYGLTESQARRHREGSEDEVNYSDPYYSNPNSQDNVSAGNNHFSMHANAAYLPTSPKEADHVYEYV